MWFYEYVGSAIVCSKMIISEELSASLDEPTDCLIMHRVEPSRMQLLALHITDKMTQLMDNNEQVYLAALLLYIFPSFSMCVSSYMLSKCYESQGIGSNASVDEDVMLVLPHIRNCRSKKCLSLCVL